MKLFVLLPKLGGGGLERMRLNLLAEFKERGIDATLVVGQKTGELVSLIPKGVRTLELAPSNPGLFLSGLLTVLLHERPTHLLCAADDVNCLAIIANRLCRLHAEVVVSNHTTLSEQIKRTHGLARIKVLILRKAMRWLYPKAASVVAVSHGVADDLALQLGMPRAAIEVIYNPVITRDFETRMTAPLPEAWPLVRAPVVLYVGRLAPEKRPDLLLSAFEHVLNSAPAHLVIAGSGPERGWMQSRITTAGLQDRITLLGFVPNALPLMRAAHVLVLPSDHEGLPNVLIEALGCGTQIVATDCPSGPREILEHGSLGRLVPVADVAQLQSAILEVITGRFKVPEHLLHARAAAFNASLSAAHYLRVLVRNTPSSSGQCDAVSQ